MKFMIYLYISNVNVRSIHFVHLYARMNIYFEVFDKYLYHEDCIVESLYLNFDDHYQPPRLSALSNLFIRTLIELLKLLKLAINTRLYILHISLNSTLKRR